MSRLEREVNARMKAVMMVSAFNDGALEKVNTYRGIRLLYIELVLLA